jgi:hypothetical protein
MFLALLCERPRHGYELFKLVSTDKALRAIWRIERSQGNDFTALVSQLRLSQTKAALDWLDQVHALIPIPN